MNLHIIPLYTVYCLQYTVYALSLVSPGPCPYCPISHSHTLTKLYSAHTHGEDTLSHTIQWALSNIQTLTYLI